MSDESTALAIGQSEESALGKFLTDLESAGQVKVRDLFPSLNAFMQEKGPGAVGAFKVLEYLQNAIDSDLQPGTKNDIVTMLDLKAGVRWAFYLSNGGMKAKFRGVGSGDVLVLFYAGKQKSATKGFSDWHDFRVIQANSEKVATELLTKASATLKFLKS